MHALKMDGQELRVGVDGQFTCNNVGMIVRAATAGVASGFVMENSVSAHLVDKRLVRVLEEWCPPIAGYDLYYPSRRQPFPAFALLVDALRRRN